MTIYPNRTKNEWIKLLYENSALIKILAHNQSRRIQREVGRGGWLPPVSRGTYLFSFGKFFVVLQTEIHNYYRHRRRMFSIIPYIFKQKVTNFRQSPQTSPPSNIAIYRPKNFFYELPNAEFVWLFVNFSITLTNPISNIWFIQWHWTSIRGHNFRYLLRNNISPIITFMCVFTSKSCHIAYLFLKNKCLLYR